MWLLTVAALECMVRNQTIAFGGNPTDGERDPHPVAVLLRSEVAMGKTLVRCLHAALIQLVCSLPAIVVLQEDERAGLLVLNVAVEPLGLRQRLEHAEITL